MRSDHGRAGACRPLTGGEATSGTMGEAVPRRRVLTCWSTGARVRRRLRGLAGMFALLLLLAGVTAFHGRGVWPGQTFLAVDLAQQLVPWRSGAADAARELDPAPGRLHSDSVFQAYPYLVEAVGSVHRGEWPLWNPHILLGHPTVSDPLAQTFYPVFLGLGLLFGAARALALGLWLHVLLAGGLTYGWLRALGGGRPAALLGAFTYALSGYLVIWFEVPFWTATLSWFPGVLWACDLALHARGARGARYVALGALAFALATLAGQFQFVAVFALFLVLFALARAVELLPAGSGATAGAAGTAGSRRGVLRWGTLAPALTTGALTAGGIVLLGLCISAVQLLPSAEALAQSRRPQFRSLTDALPVRQLVTLLVPEFFGTPPGAYRGAMNFLEGTVYAGVPALLLALVAPSCARRPLAPLTGGVALLAVYFATGGPGVSLLDAVPGLNAASLHRSAFLLPLIVALLAALAIDAPALPLGRAVVGAGLLAAAVGVAVAADAGQARSHWGELRGPLLRAATLLAITLALLAARRCGPRARRAGSYGLVAVTFADLWLFGSGLNPTGPVAQLTPTTPGIEFLRRHAAPPGAGRVAEYQLDQPIVFGPNVSSVFGLSSPGGYSSLVPARLYELVERGDPADAAQGSGYWLKQNGNVVAFSRPSRRLLDLLQVRYAVAAAPLGAAGVTAEVRVEGCAGATAEIGDARAIAGEVPVRGSAINRLDARFRVSGARRGTLAVRMWEGPDRARQVLDARLPATGLRDEQDVTWYFAPERTAPGKTYVWEVAAGDPATGGVSLCTDGDARPAVSVYGADWVEAYRGELQVVERLAPLPRAYVVYAAERVTGDGPATARLLDEDADIRNVAVTADPLPLPSLPERQADAAVLEQYGATRVAIRATARQPGLLVLGDLFAPGWKATVDGRPAPVLRVNHVMRGVFLAPGEHDVRFTYAPDSLKWGALTSLAGLGIAAVLLARGGHAGVARRWGRQSQAARRRPAGTRGGVRREPAVP
jgi:hypothetical protein